jgi:hypothetical protein
MTLLWEVGEMIELESNSFAGIIPGLASIQGVWNVPSGLKIWKSQAAPITRIIMIKITGANNDLTLLQLRDEKALTRLDLALNSPSSIRQFRMLTLSKHG